MPRDSEQLDVDALKQTLKHLAPLGCSNACLWAEDLSFASPFAPLPVLRHIVLEEGKPAPQHAAAWSERGWQIRTRDEQTPVLCDAFLIAAREAFPLFMRRAAPLMQAGKIVAPANRDWALNGRFSQAAVEYIEASNLRGHYLEFGTFWGSSFCANYRAFHRFLKNFYAFDSFAGLSKPEVLETHFTRGDFMEGEYCCNENSFRLIARMAGVPEDRLQVVPGFYSNTLRGKDPAGYGLQPESISMAVIDCDLLEPTTDVLNFIAPLLEPGAVLYFDDWFLTRASPVMGERAAALRWLAENPRFELIDFTQTGWQNKFFIFQKRL